MSLVSTLISRVAALTNAINSIAVKAKLISELPDATVALGATDQFHVNQGGVSKKVAYSDMLGGAVAAPGKVQFGSAMIFGQDGNVLTTLQSGDFVTRMWSTTEFWHLARYNGGDTEVRTNYTIYQSTEGIT